MRKNAFILLSFIACIAPCRASVSLFAQFHLGEPGSIGDGISFSTFSTTPVPYEASNPNLNLPYSIGFGVISIDTTGLAAPGSTAALDLSDPAGVGYSSGGGTYLDPLGTDNFGFGIWVKTSDPSSSSYGDIMNMGAAGGGANTSAYRISLSGTDDAPVWSFSVGDTLVSSVPVTANTWVQLSVILQGGTAALYVNGTQAGASTTLVPNTAGGLNVAYSAVDNKCFIGVIDEARIATFSPSDSTASILAALSAGTVGSSGYAAWLAQYPGLADKTDSGDSDGDGIGNLLEYVLNGNPTSPSRAILPVSTVTANSLIFTFTRKTASTAETTQTLQYSSDLLAWTSVPVNAAATGSVVLTPGTGGLETVTVTVPKTQATGGRLFCRLIATRP